MTGVLYVQLSRAPQIRAVKTEPKFQATTLAAPSKNFGSDSSYPKLLGLLLHSLGPNTGFFPRIIASFQALGMRWHSTLPC